MVRTMSPGRPWYASSPGGSGHGIGSGSGISTTAADALPVAGSGCLRLNPARPVVAFRGPCSCWCSYLPPFHACGRISDWTEFVLQQIDKICLECFFAMLHSAPQQQEQQVG